MARRSGRRLGRSPRLIARSTSAGVAGRRGRRRLRRHAALEDRAARRGSGIDTRHLAALVDDGEGAPLDRHDVGQSLQHHGPDPIAVEDRSQGAAGGFHRGPVAVHAPVEQSIDDTLEARAERIEQQDDGEEVERHRASRQAPLGAAPALEPDDQPSVAGEEDEGQRRVDDAEAEIAIDVEEIVATDRPGDRQRIDDIERREGVHRDFEAADDDPSGRDWERGGEGDAAATTFDC